MAIDSREKRQNVASMTAPMPATPTPNAAQDEDWRQQAGWGYSGISPAGQIITAQYPFFRGLLTCPGMMLH